MKNVADAVFRFYVMFILALALARANNEYVARVKLHFFCNFFYFTWMNFFLMNSFN